MGFFGKLFGKGVPDWATFFSEADYKTFASQLHEQLAAHSLRWDMRSISIPLTRNGSGASLGFSSLARRCHLFPKDEWPPFIAQYVEFALTPDGDLLDALRGSFEKASQALRVQLVPTDMARPDWVERLNYVHFGDGIETALVYDLPLSVCTVPADHVRGWHRSWDDLYAIARGHVEKELGDLTPDPVEFQGTVVQQLVDDSYFTCSAALWLERYAGPPGPRGTLISVPARHTVLYHAVRDAGAWRALAQLPLLSRTLAAKLPGEIAPSIFWQVGDRIVDVPVTESGGQLQVRPTKALCEAWDGLQEP